MKTMKRPKYFHKIDSTTIRYKRKVGKTFRLAQHQIEVENLYDTEADVDGFFVITNPKIYDNVLHFEINWMKWKGETAKIQMGIVPHYNGTTPIHQIEWSIDRDDISSAKAFIEWIRSFCIAHNRLLIEMERPKKSINNSQHEKL